MSIHRSSYLKTSLLAALAALLSVAVAYGAANYFDSAQNLLLILGWLVALPPLVVAIAGGLVIYRDHRLTIGKPDIFIAANKSRSEMALINDAAPPGTTIRRVFRGLFGSKQLLVGEWVTIRSLEEIKRTLDDADSVDGLPFLPEMVPFCGTRARVYRSVDKIYDYGGKKNLRRLRDAVLLRGLRCAGSAHGGCQAACYLIWKDQWLVRDGKQSTTATAVAAKPDIRPVTSSVGFKQQVVTDSTGIERYTCQFTQLVKASTLLNTRDLRQDFRPLLAGNLSFTAATIAVLTRVFNRVQIWRRGTGYPPIAVAGTAVTPLVKLDLVPGDRVRVRSLHDIGATLDRKSKNRGLWFDSDMVKHCGQEYRVLRRVERIIDDATGEMRQMKTPCIVLDGISYSGEGLRFCFQEDPTFWREAWLAAQEQGAGDVLRSEPAVTASTQQHG